MKHRAKDQYLLRLPSGWRAMIKDEAAKSRRTMNAEILVAIETTMRIKGIDLSAGAVKTES